MTNSEQKLHSLSKYLKISTPTFLITCFGFFLYQLRLTNNTIASIVDTKALKNERKCPEYIYLNILENPDDERDKTIHYQGGFLQTSKIFSWVWNWWERQKHVLRLKVLTTAITGSLSDRWKSVEILSKLQLDSESDFVQLAQACDATTAVGLARSKDVDLRLFLPPKGLYLTKNKEVIVGHLRDLLFELSEKSEHLCIKHFLSKAFPYLQEEYSNLDYSQVMPMEETITSNISEDNILIMSLQSLVHHCSIPDNAKEMVHLGGLPLLVDIYKLSKHNQEIKLLIGKLMTYVSKYPELLEDVFMSGWIGVLAEWAQDPDKSVSILATKCLANFDKDDSVKCHRYCRRVYLLHPTTRCKAPKVDVVFVHGLLGGILLTWKQRSIGYEDKPFSLLEITGTNNMDQTPDQLYKKSTSDNDTQDYFSVMSELQQTEFNEIGSDFEYVLTDLPTFSNTSNDQPYTLSGKNKAVREIGEDQTYTSCWPQDWLPQDCQSIRILGVNYGTRLSEWLAVCPKKMMAQSLEQRSKELLEQLTTCGIGQRPIVWITHSMGGLLVKKMLVEACKSDQQIFKNFAEKTKGIVFLGTPHKGSHLANLNELLRRIILPSSEVDDLKHDSPMLNELHDHFLSYVQRFPVKIVSFSETKPTLLSSLRIEVHLVPSHIAYPGVGEMFEVPNDHACLAKPQNRLSFIYQKVLSVIKTVVNEV